MSASFPGENSWTMLARCVYRRPSHASRNNAFGRPTERSVTVSQSETAKYIVRKPIYEEPPNEKRGEGPNDGVTTSETWMSGVQAPGFPLHIMWGIIYDIPRINPYVGAHDHPYDEVLFFQGFNPEDTLDLGAVFEFMLEDEVHVIDSTCSIYIPAGMRHNPLTVKSVARPCGLAAISLSGLYKTEGYVTPAEIMATP